MEAAKTVENHGDEWGLTWYFRWGICTHSVSYCKKFCVRCSFPNLVDGRTSQLMFPKYLIEYQNVKIDSEIKILKWKK